MSVAAVKPGFATAMQALSPESGEYVPDIVRLIISAARDARASDVHLVPDESALLMQWRVDGVLQTVAGFDRNLAARIVSRLKVISGLLTYRTDVPQEGRVAREHSATEVRVTTFPTLYGEKAAVRLFAANDRLQRLDQLELPEAVERSLRSHLDATAGVILLTGPSGSGKTTTAYACLRDIIVASQGCRCIMTLEDPIEVAVPGATQSQVRPNAGFDLTTGLRSMMRQDPDVILVGEIRDPATAEAAFQAALTGHLVLTTFHAGSAAEAVTRLLEMGIEPYLLRSGLRTVICQRLLRRCRTGPRAIPSAVPGSSDNSETMSTLDDRGSTMAVAEYDGRLVLAEQLTADHPDVVRAILNRLDAVQLHDAARVAGMRTLHDVAADAVAAGVTTRTEVLRVLGGGV